jgi:hypothetical protein
MRIRLGYPEMDGEIEVLDRQQFRHPLVDLEQVVSLEEVLEAYQDERYSPTHYSTLENRDQLNSRNNSSAFSNVYSFYYTDPSEIFLYSRSIFSHTFTDSPFDNYSESAHEVLPQEHYYNILENLITHFEQQNSDNKFIEEPF